MDYKTGILIRGAGDLATGIAHRLYKAGFRNILMVELPKPTTVRRTVSFSEAAFLGEYTVEGVKAELVGDVYTGSYAAYKKMLDNGEFRATKEMLDKARKICENGRIPVITVPSEEVLKIYHPDIYIDAIVAKWNRGTTINDGGFVVGIGPGFTAGVDCHAVIETNRGHNLGKVIYDGGAEENTGVPGKVAGHSVDRIIRASSTGIFKGIVNIGDIVDKDQVVGYVLPDDQMEFENDASGAGVPVRAQMDGVVRGLLKDGVHVKDGWKAGDVDARSQKEYCYSISDKARAIGGGVLEAVCGYISGRM